MTGELGCFHNSVRIADDRKTVAHYLKSDPAFRVGPFLIHEIASGTGEGVFTLYDQGKPLAFFALRRLLEKPPHGGVSVLSEHITIDPELPRHTSALLNKAKRHGAAMVEAKVGVDGTPYLMEINTRFWGRLSWPLMPVSIFLTCFISWRVASGPGR